MCIMSYTIKFSKIPLDIASSDLHFIFLLTTSHLVHLTSVRPSSHFSVECGETCVTRSPGRWGLQTLLFESTLSFKGDHWALRLADSFFHSGFVPVWDNTSGHSYWINLVLGRMFRYTVIRSVSFVHPLFSFGWHSPFVFHDWSKPQEWRMAIFTSKTLWLINGSINGQLAAENW